MSTLTLPLPSGRASRGARRSRVLDLVLQVVAGIRDGFAMLRRYKALAGKTDLELARIGIKRENIPNVLIDQR